jgi:hypothetical protein
MNAMGSLRATWVLLTPRQELPEQGIALGIIPGRRTSLLLQEGFEVVFERLRRLGLRLAQTLQHLIGNAEAGPSGNSRGKIDVAPFRVIRRMLEFVPIFKETFNEAFHATESIGFFRPIVDGKHGGYGNGVDLLSRRDQCRIVVMRELAQGESRNFAECASARRPACPPRE